MFRYLYYKTKQKYSVKKSFLLCAGCLFLLLKPLSCDDHRISESRSFFTLPLAKTALIHRLTTTLDIHMASWRLSTPSACPSITPLGLEMEGFFTSCSAPQQLSSI